MSKTSLQRNLDSQIERLKLEQRKRTQKVESLRKALIEVLTNPEVHRLTQKYSPYGEELFASLKKSDFATSTNLSDYEHTKWNLAVLGELSKARSDDTELRELTRNRGLGKELVLRGVHYGYGFREICRTPSLILPSYLRDRKNFCLEYLAELSSSQIWYEAHIFEDGDRGIGVFSWDGNKKQGLNPRDFKNYILNYFVKPYLELERREKK